MTIIVFYEDKEICETNKWYWITEYLEDAVYMKEIRIKIKKKKTNK